MVAERDLNGHGTHVAGTAAGNGLGAAGDTSPGQFAGIAPQADLVIVKASRDEASNTGFGTDDVLVGLLFVQDQARQLGRPWVANLSLGAHDGIGDGTSPLEVGIDNILNQSTGCHIVIAAGNAGGLKIHGSGVLTEGADVVIPFVVNQAEASLSFTYNPSDTVSAKLISPGNTILGPLAAGTNASDSSAEIDHPTTLAAPNTRQVSIMIHNASSATWNLVIKPTRVINGRWDVAVNSNPIQAITLDASIADGISSLGTPGTSKSALTVGMYVSKMVGGVGAGRVYITSDPLIGTRVLGSSMGPTRDGRLKPEILAPGSRIMSSKSADEPLSANDDANDSAKHTLKQGTSMATPVVVGTVALNAPSESSLDA